MLIVFSHSSYLILVISNKYLSEYYVFSKLFCTSSCICNLAITAVLHDNSFLASNMDRSDNIQIPPDLAFYFFFLFITINLQSKVYYCYITISKIIFPACVEASLAKTNNKLLQNNEKNLEEHPFFLAQYFQLFTLWLM